MTCPASYQACCRTSFLRLHRSYAEAISEIGASGMVSSHKLKAAAGVILIIILTLITEHTSTGSDSFIERRVEPGFKFLQEGISDGFQTEISLPEYGLSVATVWSSFAVFFALHYKMTHNKSTHFQGLNQKQQNQKTALANFVLSLFLTLPLSWTAGNISNWLEESPWSIGIPIVSILFTTKYLFEYYGTTASVVSHNIQVCCCGSLVGEAAEQDQPLLGAVDGSGSDGRGGSQRSDASEEPSASELIEAQTANIERLLQEQTRAINLQQQSEAQTTKIGELNAQIAELQQSLQQHQALDQQQTDQIVAKLKEVQLESKNNQAQLSRLFNQILENRTEMQLHIKSGDIQHSDANEHSENTLGSCMKEVTHASRADAAAPQEEAPPLPQVPPPVATLAKQESGKAKQQVSTTGGNNSSQTAGGSSSQRHPGLVSPPAPAPAPEPSKQGTKTPAFGPGAGEEYNLGPQGQEQPQEPEQKKEQAAVASNTQQIQQNAEDGVQHQGANSSLLSTPLVKSSSHSEIGSRRGSHSGSLDTSNNGSGTEHDDIDSDSSQSHSPSPGSGTSSPKVRL